jgi:hypothetical protein
MWDVGCGMWDMGYGMWDVECGWVFSLFFSFLLYIYFLFFHFSYFSFLFFFLFSFLLFCFFWTIGAPLPLQPLPIILPQRVLGIVRDCAAVGGGASCLIPRGPFRIDWSIGPLICGKSSSMGLWDAKSPVENTSKSESTFARNSPFCWPYFSTKKSLRGELFWVILDPIIPWTNLFHK